MKHFSLPNDGGLIEDSLPKGILHSFERITTEISDDAASASEKVADIISKAIADHSKSGLPRPFKLGLSTGVTPISLFECLTRKYREGEVSFANVEVFSIDEYYPCDKESSQSRNNRLRMAFLDKVDVQPGNIHIPDGTIPQTALSDYCAEFDKLARGIDILVMGVGEGGQIGFNESGSSEKSRTRTVPLSYQSRKRQARSFNGEISAETAAEHIQNRVSILVSERS